MSDVKNTSVSENLVLNDQSLTAAEKKLIAILRDVKFGKIEVVIQDGIPIRVDEIRKSIKI